jgi:hypothetical protein
MRAIYLALCIVAIACTAFGSITAASPAKQLAESVLNADSVTIEFYSRSGKEEVTFSDSAWLYQLSRILEDASYSPRSHCLCISFPQIRLSRKNEKIGSLSVHHGEKLRAYVGGVSGDFFVGEKVGRAILDLANEKKE